MKYLFKLLIAIIFTISYTHNTIANDGKWGGAKDTFITYKPNKVLYDLTTGNISDINNILDRIGLLYKLYESDNLDSSIIVIIHGDAIPFFARKNFDKYEGLMLRANSLTIGTSIEFRMCSTAAKAMQYNPQDIHGFVKMVPMADAEIVKLQKEYYSYMR